MPKKGHGYYGDLGDSPLAQWLYKHKVPKHMVRATNVRREEVNRKKDAARKKQRKSGVTTVLSSGRAVV